MSKGVNPPLKLRFNIHLTRDVEPTHLGSALRSAFGWSLRGSACALGLPPDCIGCPVQRDCLYSRLFDPLPPLAPVHPSFTAGIPGYAIAVQPSHDQRPLRTGQVLHAALLLLAPQPEDLPVIEQALFKAVDRNRGFLNGVARIGAGERVPLPTPQLPDNPSPPTDGRTVPQKIRLHLESPLAVKLKSEDLRQGHAFNAELIWRLAWRRLQQWAQCSGAPIPNGEPWRQAFKTLSLDATALRHVVTFRDSKRHDNKQPLAGFVGELAMTGNPEALVTAQQLLHVVVPLQIGKDTAFGLGVARLSAD